MFGMDLNSTVHVVDDDINDVNAKVSWSLLL